jgi:hypothetical protein
MTLHRRTAAFLTLIISAAALPGCSPAGTALPSTEPAASATTETCGDAAATVQEHLNSTDVTTVTVDGQCTNITIDTALSDEDTAGGKLLCERAGEVAYTGDVNSVTVRSTSKAELSVGIPGATCLP